MNGPAPPATVINAEPLFPPKQETLLFKVSEDVKSLSTVTTTVFEDVLPEPSVAVRTTVFAPRFEQVNIFGERFSVTIPQLSVDPLFTAEGITVTVPPERVTVTF